MMFVYFILFTALGAFLAKASESDPKMGVGWIVAIAIFWGFTAAPIWGLAALGEMLLGYVVVNVVMPKKPSSGEKPPE